MIVSVVTRSVDGEEQFSRTYRARINRDAGHPGHGSSPVPSTASIGSEICRSVHRINPSESWRYEDTARVGLFSPF